MATTQSSISFPDLLMQSGLLTAELVNRLIADNPQHSRSARSFAEFLVAKDYITRWQSRKLLEGRHRGFFLGPFELRSHLAKGGMSTLYVARRTESGEPCVLKVLPPSRSNESEASYLPRFLREARLACELRHPNIIRVHEVLSARDGDNDIHFMAMELLTGKDLFGKVATEGALPIRRAAEVIRQAAVGLDYAHSTGLIHRDVKPGNVFESSDGTIKILDLGLAGIVDDGQHENLTREYNERILGTADYLAPEQAIDSHRADSRADIYGLGCTFYFVLTGRPPFVEGTLPQRILAHQTKDPDEVCTIRRDVPEPLLELLRRMLIKKRAKRIQTCKEVAELLGVWLSENADDTQFDLPADMQPAEPKPKSRRLQKIQPVRRNPNRESPTDSIQASETQTATSIPIIQPKRNAPVEAPQTDSSESEAGLKTQPESCEATEVIDCLTAPQSLQDIRIGPFKSDAVERKRSDSTHAATASETDDSQEAPAPIWPIVCVTVLAAAGAIAMSVSNWWIETLQNILNQFR